MHRVVIFANSFRLGGSERQAVELAKRLDRSLFEPIITCFQRQGPLIKELPDDVRDIEAYPIKGFLTFSAATHGARFLRLLKQRQVHVVQCFDFYSNIFAIPLARLAGVPVVLAARRDESALRTRGQRVAERFLFRLATGVVANAAAIRRQLVENDGVHPDKVWVIHNGLDLRRFVCQNHPSVRDDDKDAAIKVAVLANLRPEKGHLVFLRAAERIAQRFANCEFLIAGDGPMRDVIKSRIAKSGLGGRVRMMGEIREVGPFLHAVDIVVLPSLANEGLPNALMEAMAASKPVVATDTGGTRELVIDGQTGYIVPPGTSIPLAERVAQLCADPHRRRRMGQRGRQRLSQTFTAEAMAHNFARLYSNLLS